MSVSFSCSSSTLIVIVIIFTVSISNSVIITSARDMHANILMYIDMIFEKKSKILSE